MARGSGWAESAFGSSGGSARSRRDFYSSQDWQDIEDAF